MTDKMFGGRWICTVGAVATIVAGTLMGIFEAGAVLAILAVVINSYFNRADRPNGVLADMKKELAALKEKLNQP